MSPRRLLALLAFVALVFVCVRACGREQGREVAEPERERGSGELSAQEPSREPIVTEVAAPEPATSLAVLAVMLESWPEADALTGAQVELVRGAMRELARPVQERPERHEARVATGDWLVRISVDGYRDEERALTLPVEGLELRVSLSRADTTLLRARSADGATLAELARGLGEAPSSFVETYASLWWSRDGSEELRALVPLRRDKDGEPLFELVRSEMDRGTRPDLLGVLRHGTARGTWLSLTVGSRSGEWIFVPASEREAELPFGLARDEFRKPDVVLRVSRSIPEAQAWLESLDSRREGREAQQVPPSGLVRFEGVEPGDYLACVGVRGGQEERRLARVRLGRDLDLGSFELGALALLEVVVVDGNGRRLPALVQLGPFERTSTRPQGYAARGVRTDADGVARVEFTGGDVVLLARVLDGADSVVAGHETAPLLVQGPATSTRVELVVREPARVGVRGVRGRLAIVDAQGVVVGGTVELGSEWGGYLQPGRYRALDRALTGDLQAERSFDVRAGDELDLEMR